MSAKTKIIVLHMKEVIYTGIFLLLAVILAIVLFFMFGSGQKKSDSADAKSLYKPGIYTSSIDLNENTFDLEVTAQIFHSYFRPSFVWNVFLIPSHFTASRQYSY